MDKFGSGLGEVSGVNKKEIAVLGKAFAAEVEDAITHSPRLFQGRGKVIEKLVAGGLLRKKSERLGGRFPITIEGYELTSFGRVSYCMTCQTEVEAE